MSGTCPLSLEPFGGGGSGSGSGNSKICLCLHMVFLLQCVSESKLPLTRTPVTGLVPTLTQYDLINLHLFTSTKAILRNKVTFTGSQWTWKWEQGRHTIPAGTGSKNLVKFSYFPEYLGVCTWALLFISSQTKHPLAFHLLEMWVFLFPTIPLLPGSLSKAPESLTNQFSGHCCNTCWVCIIL